MPLVTKVEPLVGIVNNSNTVYITPEAFVPGSVRIIWNGNVYKSSDERHGFTETDTNEITTVRAPRTGDVLLAIYYVNAGSSSTPSDDYADGVQNLAELIAITQAEREDRQIRLVEDENALYRFDVGASIGGIVPGDVDDGRWFRIGDQILTYIGSPFHPSGALP